MRKHDAGSIVNVSSGITFSALEHSHAPQPQKPEQVAEATPDLIKTGDEQAGPAPEQFGGRFKG